MRLPSPRFVISTLVLTTVLVAATLASVLVGPRDAGAQDVPSGGGLDGRYQVVFLGPRDERQRDWLLLDTHTGTMQHWSDEGTYYLVFSDLRPGKSETIRSRVPKGRGTFMPPDTSRIR